MSKNIFAANLSQRGFYSNIANQTKNEASYWSDRTDAGWAVKMAIANGTDPSAAVGEASLLTCALPNP